MAFNPSQMEAVHHMGGPMMVLAGPGSGKTTVITHRTKNLIEEGIEPGSILVITFTRAAAREMQERFEALMEGKSVRVSFGTFHSVFFTILKYAYRYQPSDIVREDQRQRCIREMLEEYDLEIEDEHEFVPAILSEISFVKSEMISLDHYYSRNCSESVFKKLYQGYEDHMRRAGLLDFDDMLVMCHELFCQRKDILKAWQNKFRYILIDEFQDINKVQYEIVKMLALPHNNLFIVGDDDQSVYRFRGAKPEIMLGFTKDYPDAKTVLLGTNYRSTRQIVDTASALISRNTKRYEKKLTAFRGDGKPVGNAPQAVTMELQAGRGMSFAAKSARTSLMYINQGNRRKETKEMIENRNVNIITDADGKKLVLINDIRFKGKRQIDWDDVKQYLEGYVGDYYEIAENAERIYIGNELPEEYTESESRKSLMGANAKAKANAATAIPELIQIASNPAFKENCKEKHNKNAKYGWYRYDVRFALPVYEENTLVRYNIFHARLLINHAENGRKYLYDILAIKKETSKP